MQINRRSVFHIGHSCVRTLRQEGSLGFPRCSQRPQRSNLSGEKNIDNEVRSVSSSQVTGVLAGYSQEFRFWPECDGKPLEGSEPRRSLSCFMFVRGISGC